MRQNSMPGMRRVIIESPYAGDREKNLRYLQACIADCLKRGDAPFASHGLYPGALDDNIPEERQLGIEAGFTWRDAAHATIVYKDLGVTRGMLLGIEHAEKLKHVIEYRTLGGEWSRSETSSSSAEST